MAISPFPSSAFRSQPPRSFHSERLTFLTGYAGRNARISVSWLPDFPESQVWPFFFFFWSRLLPEPPSSALPVLHLPGRPALFQMHRSHCRGRRLPPAASHAVLKPDDAPGTCGRWAHTHAPAKVHDYYWCGDEEWRQPGWNSARGTEKWYKSIICMEGMSLFVCFPHYLSFNFT